MNRRRIYSSFQMEKKGDMDEVNSAAVEKKRNMDEDNSAAATDSDISCRRSSCPAAASAADEDDGTATCLCSTSSSPKKKRKKKKQQQQRHSKQGRRGDPRMHRAVAERLANPKSSLLDALLKGGFVFTSLLETDDLSSSANANGDQQRIDDTKVFDIDEISLGQRKNQLSRRLRIEKEKEKGKKKDLQQSGRVNGTSTICPRDAASSYRFPSACVPASAGDFVAGGDPFLDYLHPNNTGAASNINRNNMYHQDGIVAASTSAAARAGGAPNRGAREDIFSFDKSSSVRGLKDIMETVRDGESATTSSTCSSCADGLQVLSNAADIKAPTSRRSGIDLNNSKNEGNNVAVRDNVSIATSSFDRSREGLAMVMARGARGLKGSHEDKNCTTSGTTGKHSGHADAAIANDCGVNINGKVQHKEDKDKIELALEIYRQEHGSLLKRCLMLAGVEESKTDEYGPLYMTFSEKAVQVEKKRLEALSLCSKGRHLHQPGKCGHKVVLHHPKGEKHPHIDYIIDGKVECFKGYSGIKVGSKESVWPSQFTCSELSCSHTSGNDEKKGADQHSHHHYGGDGDRNHHFHHGHSHDNHGGSTSSSGHNHFNHPPCPPTCVPDKCDKRCYSELSKNYEPAILNLSEEDLINDPEWSFTTDIAQLLNDLDNSAITGGNGIGGDGEMTADTIPPLTSAVEKGKGGKKDDNKF
mmetsp:Transcript_36642/g.110061  ORF Transcript_36642/g.110061 Transcript_36642/m.110061 type:complete len:699 (-) Transcript_36642:246-2342(-)